MTPKARAAARGAALLALLGAVVFGAVVLASAGAAASAPTAPLPAPFLHSPTTPFVAVRLFDPPAAAWSPGHRGIDLDASVGDVVLAPADGTVTFAGVVVDRGVVTVDHGGALRSSVEPIAPSVQVGDRVREGEALGSVSDEPGHCAPDTCVHWGVRLGNAYLNPLDVLDGYGPVVLLPLVEGARTDERLP